MPTLKAARGGNRTLSAQFTDFPSVWSIVDPKNIVHEGKGVYSYVGAGGSGEEDVGLIKTINPLDSSRNGGIASFEILLTSTGESKYIALGVCSDNYPSHSLPGWTKVSVGLHMDDGSLFQSSDEATKTNQVFQKGDIIKCCIREFPPSDFAQPDKVEVQFSSNNMPITSVVVENQPGGFYGVIGMMSKGEVITISPPVVSKMQRFVDVWEVSTPALVQQKENGVCSYIGPGDLSEHSIGSVRGTRPIDPLGDLSQRSFSLRILYCGEKNFIGMGIVNKTYSTNLLPGWEDSSIGYHADGGEIFQRSSDGIPTNGSCSNGDIMQCVVKGIDNSPKQILVTFFKNNEKMADVTDWTPSTGFYFCFGMMSKGEVVQVILPDVVVPYAIPKLEFEDVWAIMNTNIEHRGSGICYYIGEEKVGTVRSKKPLDPFSSYNYFEVKIVEPGKSSYIALGVCNQLYSTDCLPGWEDLSVGYHADEGSILQKNAGQVKASDACKKGDVIRCTLELVDGSDKQMNVIYHQNGSFVGKAIFWKPGDGQVFAQIGCMSEGEVIQIASPCQTILQLKPDNPPSASYPKTRSSPGLSPGGSVGQRQHEDVRLSHYRTFHPGSKNMEQFFHDMYHQFHGIPHPGISHPSGKPSSELPFVHAGPTGPGTNMTLPFPSGWQQYQGYGHYPHGLSSSFPAPVRSGGRFGHPKQLLSQLSERAHPSYFEQMSTSSSSSTASAPMSELPTQYSSQFSASSVSSLESVPEGSGSERGLEDEATKHQPLLSLQPTKQDVLASAYGGTSDLGSFTKTTPRTLEECRLDSYGSLSTIPDIGSLSSIETVHPSRESTTLLRSPSIVVEPAILTKDENRMFKILHNTQVDADGSLEYACLHADSPDNSFIMFRFPLNEKCNYFEVEVLQMNQSSNIAIGIVWDHYPVYRLPGILEGSAAYHTKDSTIWYGKKTQRTDITCVARDVVGCRVALKYKSEVVTLSDKTESHVEVEFFRNGILLYVQEVFLPPNGFFPAIGMTGFGTKICTRHDMQLMPESYFKTHPLPSGYLNFVTPSDESTGWQCLQRSKMDRNNLYVDGECCGKPAVIQSNLPFSSSSVYCDVELQSDIASYSVLSIGVASKLSLEAKKNIPGETANSVGYLPLLGFFMSDGVICWTVPEKVSSHLYGKKTTIGVGIEHCTLRSDHDVQMPSNGLKRIKLFFTVNGQQVHDIFTDIPEDGLYPTLAVERDCGESSECLAVVTFPKQFPCSMQGLPLGFSRDLGNGFELQFDSYTVKDKLGVDRAFREEATSVRAMQAAQPLSPSRSYFEVRIVHGGETFKISCGLAGYNYPLNIHPGWANNSVALHADDGNLFDCGHHTNIIAPPRYRGALIGCGIRFPDNITNMTAEVFFTLNKNLVASKLVKVPQLGLYPTIGMRTLEGIIEVNIHAQDPCPSLKFKNAIEVMENMKMDGSVVELLSSSNPGAIQMSSSSLHEQNFIEVSSLSERRGSIMVGFSTGKNCPLNFLKSQAFKACVLDIVSGKLLLYNQYYKSRDACSVVNSRVIGVGLEPIPDSNQLLLFITSNGYVVSYSEVDIQDAVCPCVLMIDSTTKLMVDLCSSWPKQSPIGRGWGTCANLKLVDLKITHSCTVNKKRLPVGYAQAAVPLTRSSCYFEVEICSRAANKAIAIGLASRTHLATQWIGWSENSIGYHTDDGKLFKENSSGQSFGPKAYAGDVIGCGARLNQVCYRDSVSCNTKMKVEVFFTINGALLNTQKMTIPPGGFFPTLCLESPSESVVFHRYKSFPPVVNLVDITDWANAYSVKEVGKTISNCCRHKEINGGLPKAFCQARLPFSSDKPYFQVEIASLGIQPKGCILVGASVKIPVGCTTPNTHSLSYSNIGQIITRKGSQKSSKTSAKSDVGDVIGCCISFSNGVPSQADIYINHSRVHTGCLTGLWTPQDLYPTIILSHPGDSVIPNLQMEFPSWDHPPLIGWLRSERVLVHNNIIEYTAQAKHVTDIGVAQISQPFRLDAMTYYEVEIIDFEEKCIVGVGAASADYPLNKQPGWCKNSIAYHGDDGKLFHQAGSGIPFASAWKRRDVIGLGIRSPCGLALVHDPTGLAQDHDSVQVYFTKNGIELGHTTVSVPQNGLFPIVGFHSVGLKVKVSLGLPGTLPCNMNSLRAQWRALSGIHMENSPNGQLLGYRMNGRTPTNLYSISLAVYAQLFSTTMQYFEVELHSIGPTGIAIGVAPHNYPLDQAPGWHVGSIAYHTDDGRLYNAAVKGKEFGPVAHCGDVIGCGITFLPNNTKYCSIFFTYNSMEIGRIRATYPTSRFYPALGLTDSRDKVSVRFHEAFKPRLSHSEIKSVNLMRINNCSYSEQIISFRGSGNSGFSSAPAMAQFSVPLGREHSYYATNIVECKDNILIGLAVKDYPLQYVPGITSISLAYDIVKGNIRAVYNSENFYTANAPVCIQGDSIGCGIHFSDDTKTESAYVYFTHNNVLVHKFDISDELLLEDFYPIVGFIPKNKFSSVFMDWNNFVFVQRNIF